MSASNETHDRKPAAALHRGELPVWPVLVVSALVLYLGLGRTTPASDLAERAGARVAHAGDALDDAVRREGSAALPHAAELDPVERSDAQAMGRNASTAARQSAASGEGSAPPAANAPFAGARPGAWQFESSHVPGGLAAESGTYSRGTRHGVWEVRWSGGGIRTRGQFDYGKRTGLWEEFNEVGKLVEEIAYVDGQRHGEWRSWSDEGELLGEGEYTSSLRNGPWVLYYSDGRVRERGAYSNGLREGTWEFYDDLGRPTPRAGTYVAGIRVQ